MFGDEGVIEVDQAWDNGAPVKVRKRHVIRRKLLNSPVAKRFRVEGETHPKVGRWGAASMNFALGPAEMLSALGDGRACLLTADFALHLNEVTLAIQNSGGHEGVQSMSTEFAPMEPTSFAALAGAVAVNLTEKSDDDE